MFKQTKLKIMTRYREEGDIVCYMCYYVIFEYSLQIYKIIC